MFSYGPPHMAEPKQGNQLECTYSCSVMIWDVALRTCQERWTIGRSGERGSRISVLVARQDDEMIYINMCVCVCASLSLSIYISIYINIYIYTHTHIHTYICMYLPNHFTTGKILIQDQFLSGEQIVWIQGFHSPWLVA